MQTTSPIAAVPLALATAVAWTSCEPAQGSNDRPYSFLIVSETGVRDPSAKHRVGLGVWIRRMDINPTTVLLHTSDSQFASATLLGHRFLATHTWGQIEERSVS